MIEKERLMFRIYEKGIRINNGYRLVVRVVPDVFVPWERIVAIFWISRGGNDTPKYMIILDSGEIVHMAITPIRDLFHLDEMPTDQLYINEAIRRFQIFLTEQYHEKAPIRRLKPRRLFDSHIQMIIIRPGKHEMAHNVLNERYFRERYFNIPFFIGILIPSVLIASLVRIQYSLSDILSWSLISGICMACGYFPNRIDPFSAIKQYNLLARVKGNKCNYFSGEPILSLVEIMSRTCVHQWFARDRNLMDVQ